MISSPEAAKFVLNKAQLFKPTFPASKERMLGKQAIFFHQGEYHANLRRLVLRTFMPEAIKNIVPDIESIAEDSLKSMEGGLITTFLEMKTVSLQKQSKKQSKTEQKTEQNRVSSVFLFIFLKKIKTFMNFYIF
jgi:cytochrome P450